MEELLLLIQNVGFPILSVIIVAWYMMKLVDHIMLTNKTLIETHINLLKSIDFKLDKLIDGGNN